MVVFSPRNVTIEIKPFWFYFSARAGQPHIHKRNIPWSPFGRWTVTGNYPSLWVGETQTLSRLSLIVLSLRFRPGFDWDSSFCSIWLMLPIFLQMLCWVSPSQLNQAQNQTETWIYFKNPVAGMEQHTALFTGQTGDFLHPGLFFFYFFLNPGGLRFFFSLGLIVPIAFSRLIPGARRTATW